MIIINQSILMSTMSRLFILGDSNVYRNCPQERLSGKIGRPVTLLNTTRLHTLELGLKEPAKSESDTLFVCVLANILRDHTIGKDVKDLKEVINCTIADVLKLVSESCSSFSRVLINTPLLRYEPSWYLDYYVYIQECLRDQVELYPKFALLPLFRITKDDLEVDGIHLNVLAGGKYFNHIVSCILDLSSGDDSELFLSPSPEVPASSSIFSSNREPTSADVLAFLQSNVVPKLVELNGVKDKVVALERRYDGRFKSVSLSIAGVRDDVDQMTNDKKADRLVVTGLPVPAEFPSSSGDQNVVLSSVLWPLVEEALGEIVFDLFVKQTPSSSKYVSPFDLKFTNVKDCQEFKKKAFKLVKGKEGFGKIEFHPKLVLGSRVHLEILRAISRKMLSSEESGYCPLHANRPVLHVGPFTDGKVTRHETLTFIEAIDRYERLIGYDDLYFAYQHVGHAFKGKLQEYFVFLNDEDRMRFIQDASKSKQYHTLGRGTKRKMSDRGGIRGGHVKRGR